MMKALRTLRVLRPLRMVSRVRGLRIAITSLIMAIPAVVNLQLAILFFLFILSILHMTLFGGRFWHCNFDHLTENGSLSFEQSERLINTKWDCLNHGGAWVNADFHFDSLSASLVTLFSIQSTEGWNDPVMWSQTDATGVDMQPKEWAASYFILFSIFVNLITNLLFLNLFVGVVIEAFNEQKNKLVGLQQLTQYKQDWINMQIMGYQATPAVRPIVSKDNFWLRNQAIKMVTSWVFDTIVMVCICANAIVMCLTWYGQSERATNITSIINLIFVGFFTLELIIKLIAMKTDYFKSQWNIFDFLVITLTLCALAMQWLNIADYRIQATIVRTFRLLRLLRILRFTKRLSIIFNTLVEAAPSMGSLGLLLLLVIFMFAVIGTRLFAFANVTDQETVNYHNNFKTFRNSFILLLRSATGEAWDNIMFDVGRSQSILFQCEHNQGYEDLDPTNPVTNQCGYYWVAITFFVVFIIIVCQIFLSLFIAIIVDSFVNQSQAEDQPVT